MIVLLFNLDKGKTLIEKKHGVNESSKYRRGYVHTYFWSSSLKLHLTIVHNWKLCLFSFQS